VRKNVVSALSEVADEEAIADLVEQVLDDMRQADRETPDVSVFDEEAGE
jgi:HEAT repeat protein